MKNDEVLLTIELPGIRKLRSGKVRDIFDLGDRLLLVATDRISAFDVVLPNGIPRKGEVLNKISIFWFKHFENIVPNHVLAFGEDLLRDPAISRLTEGYKNVLIPRAMIVRKAKPLPVEAIVRGFLAGSGWKEYKRSGTVCGIKLPEGLVESAELPEPIFTPSTKAEVGHDENISFERACEIVGRDLSEKIRELSLKIYKGARDYARERGIIIADTKFEFGRVDGEVILIDELLTPDSSRFWPASEYRPGQAQPSFDKQYVRDYLESIGWDKTPPAPELPPEVVARTSEKYIEAYERLTGSKL
jgi:phosphoribosylaminoimidazole-succinocarboxamide synthase